MALKAVVTGATGLLGRQILRLLNDSGWEAIGVGFSRASPPIIKLDLKDIDNVAYMIKSLMPSVVIHSAANRFPDQCDNDKVEAHALNVKASSNLASFCAVNNILFIYISTDYVFSGRPGEAPYETDSTPEPANFYGETKLNGERAVLKVYEEGAKRGWAVILRVPVLYGEALSNNESAVNILMDCLWSAQKDGKKVQIDHWSKRYPTNTNDVARVCQDVARKYLSTKDKSLLPTILHFSSEQSFTKYEICQLFSKIQDLPNNNINPDTHMNDETNAIHRPYDCHLSTKSLKDLGISVLTVDFENWWRSRARSFPK